MPKRSSNAKSGPSEGIQQAPTAPSVSGQASNSEAAKALSKKARKAKRQQREAEGLPSGVSNESLASEGSGKKRSKSKRGKRSGKGGDAASVDGQNRTPEPPKKKKKSKGEKAKEALAAAANAPGQTVPNGISKTSKNASASSSRGNSDKRQNGAGSANGSRESTIIGTGHFVANSLPQIGKKRKFDRMMQDQMEQARQRSSRVLTPWCADIDWFSASNMTQLLNDEILACSAWISPTYEEHEIRKMMISKVRHVIQRIESNARVYAFGSHETKLYLPGGDIDIVVDSTTVRSRNPRDFFYGLMRALENAGICRRSDIEPVLAARVPIIKIRTLQGGIKIDISLYNTNGVKAGEVVKEYLDALPAARPLVLLVKAYMWRIAKNEVFQGGIGSYSMICLAISFLQQHPKIRNNEIDPMKNLGILLIEFFELYGLVFNWDKLGISIREGGSYFNKRDRNWHKAQALEPNMAIEDPQDQTNDISKGTYKVYSILESFREAYDTLRGNVEKRAGELRSWQATPREGKGAAYHRNWTDIDGHFMPQRMSLLSTVIGFDETTINHRAGLGELYHSRALHRELGVEFVEPPMTARQAAKQSHIPSVPSADSFSINLPSSSRLPMSTRGTESQHRKRDTVSAIMMDEADPEEVGQGEEHAVFDSDSELSDARHHKTRQPPRRRIMTPPDSPSGSSHMDVRSVIEVSDEDSEEESTRYRLRARRRPVKGSKESELELGSDDRSETDGVIDVDDESDGIEIVDNQPGSSSEVPVVHFSETTSRPREDARNKGHTFRPADTLHHGRHTSQKARETESPREDRLSPPPKKIKPSRSSRQQFWQSKSGVETGSGNRERDADQSGEFESDWQADLDKARAEASGRDAVAANDDFISF